GLLDARPVDAGEKESIGRRPRRGRGAAKPRGGRAAGGSPGYSDLGRAVADKVVELGRENAQLRAEARQLREETRDARARMDDAERRARSSSERARELEGRAERNARRRLIVERLRVLTVDPVAYAAQLREVTQALLLGRRAVGWHAHILPEPTPGSSTPASQVRRTSSPKLPAAAAGNDAGLPKRAEAADEPQLTAFFTSAAIFASSAAVNFVSAKAVGHMAPLSRFAASLK